jgi:hypothetical protein
MMRQAGCFFLDQRRDREERRVVGSPRSVLYFHAEELDGAVADVLERVGRQRFAWDAAHGGRGPGPGVIGVVKAQAADGAAASSLMLIPSPSLIAPGSVKGSNSFFNKTSPSMPIVPSPRQDPDSMDLIFAS